MTFPPYTICVTTGPVMPLGFQNNGDVFGAPKPLEQAIREMEAENERLRKAQCLRDLHHEKGRLA